MKKFKLWAMAGALALFMTLFSANTVALADETANAKGNVIVQDEEWDANTASNPVVLNNVNAKELIVESGSENVLNINGGKIDTLSVVAPKMEEIGYEEIVSLIKLGMPAEEVADMYRNYLVARKEVNKLNPTIKVAGDAVIDAMAVSGGANLNLSGGNVKEVVVNNNNNPEMLTITIQNYNGKVRVDQKDNADGTANQLTIKLVNSQLTELNVSGQNNCSVSVQGDKASNVASASVDGSIYMVMNVTAKDLVVNKGAEKSSVRVYANVENVVVNANNCEFSVAVDAKVTNAIIEGDNVKVRYTGTIENAEVNGEGSDVKYAKITPIPLPTATPKPTKAPKPTATPKPEGTIIGNEDCTTPWWTAFSDSVKIEEGETETITFWNYTNGVANWNNFIVILKDDSRGQEYAVMRADNWGWLNGDANNAIPDANKASMWNWDTFVSDISGAKVELTIKNNGDTADVKANITSKSGKKFYQNYTGIAIDGDLYYCLSVEGGYLIIPETEDSTPQEPEIGEDTKVTLGNEDFSTGWWGAHSEPITVKEGTSETVTFKNYNNLGANWNNFVVVLNNEAGDKEYAVVRADNYGWTSAGNTGDNLETLGWTLDSFWNWDAFSANLNGATVELTVTNNGTTADIVANVTSAAGESFFQKYLGIAIDGDLSYHLTVDGCYLVFEK